MSLSQSNFFPSIDSGLNHIGFLFGAGTSKEAGYPLMSDLTKTVICGLTPDSKTTLEKVLKYTKTIYNVETGTPNIEIILDLIEASSNTPRHKQLKDEISILIINTLLSVKSPDLSDHVRFLEALKLRTHGANTKVTIFTTNYDVLFELAAGKVGLRLETGFNGVLKRTFDPSVFDLARGTIKDKIFSAKHELHINLIKLHGSISWHKENDHFIESSIDIYTNPPPPTIVLPRRTKIMDAIVAPIDQLFAKSAQMLGRDCKYLVSCGFSYGDKHINEQLILPNLKENKIRLCAMYKEEPECLSELKEYPSFHVGLPDEWISCQGESGNHTDPWEFSELVNLLHP